MENFKTSPYIHSIFQKYSMIGMEGNVEINGFLQYCKRNKDIFGHFLYMKKERKEESFRRKMENLCREIKNLDTIILEDDRSNHATIVFYYMKCHPSKKIIIVGEILDRDYLSQLYPEIQYLLFPHTINPKIEFAYTPQIGNSPMSMITYVCRDFVYKMIRERGGEIPRVVVYCVNLVQCEQWKNFYMYSFKNVFSNKWYSWTSMKNRNAILSDEKKPFILFTNQFIEKKIKVSMIIDLGTGYWKNSGVQLEWNDKSTFIKRAKHNCPVIIRIINPTIYHHLPLFHERDIDMKDVCMKLDFYGGFNHFPVMVPYMESDKEWVSFYCRSSLLIGQSKLLYHLKKLKYDYDKDVKILILIMSIVLIDLYPKISSHLKYDWNLEFPKQFRTRFGNEKDELCLLLSIMICASLQVDLHFFCVSNKLNFLVMKETLKTIDQTICFFYEEKIIWQDIFRQETEDPLKVNIVSKHRMFISWYFHHYSEYPIVPLYDPEYVLDYKKMMNGYHPRRSEWRSRIIFREHEFLGKKKYSLYMNNYHLWTKIDFFSWIEAGYVNYLLYCKKKRETKKRFGKCHEEIMELISYRPYLYNMQSCMIEWWNAIESWNQLH